MVFRFVTSGNRALRPPLIRSSHVLRLLLLLSSSPALAANLGILHGTVHDDQGKAIPGVQVQLFARQNVRLDVHATDASGHFEFEQVPFGRYRLLFSAPDGRMDDREVQIASGDVLELEVTLPVLEETVTVVAPQREAPRPATTPSSASHLERDDIRALPRGDTASVNEILSTQPGFVYDAMGQIYVRGNHANIQYQLDGVPLPDSVSGLFGQFLSPKLVENMEIITGGLPAEYGQRLSAVVNLNSRRPSPDGEGQAELTYGSFHTLRSKDRRHLLPHRGKLHLDGPGARPSQPHHAGPRPIPAGARLPQGGRRPGREGPPVRAGQLLPQPFRDSDRSHLAALPGSLEG
jgi:carboxypeptidase family protein/TonB-dependent receptor-like protein